MYLGLITDKWSRKIPWAFIWEKRWRRGPSWTLWPWRADRARTDLGLAVARRDRDHHRPGIGLVAVHRDAYLAERPAGHLPPLGPGAGRRSHQTSRWPRPRRDGDHGRRHGDRRRDRELRSRPHPRASGPDRGSCDRSRTASGSARPPSLLRLPRPNRHPSRPGSRRRAAAPPSRRTSLAARSRPSATPSTAASATALEAAMPGIYIDAQIGLEMQTGLAVVQSLAASGTLRHIVIFGLGTNGTVTATQLRQLRHAIGSGRDLILVNTFGPQSWEREVNTVLAAAARAPDTWRSPTGTAPSQPIRPCSGRTASTRSPPGPGSTRTSCSPLSEPCYHAASRRLAPRPPYISTRGVPGSSARWSVQAPPRIHRPSGRITWWIR